MDAVHTVAAGDSPLDPGVTRDLVRQFLTTTTAPADPAAVRQLAGLTERERQVLRVIASGYSDAELVRELAIAESTAKTHVKRILAKVGARDRAQAVVFAYQGGLMAA